MEWGYLVGKRIFVVLKSNHNYKGNVISVNGDFITIIDKFGEKVTINSKEIYVLKEDVE